MSIVEATTEKPLAPEASWTTVVQEWVTTVDHKRIGILYILSALFYLVVGGVEALLLRWQLLWPRSEFLGPDFFNQMFTMHGTTMVFFMGMAMLIGFGNYLVPLMIGARDMAFPRLNALGFWVTLLGGILVYSSFLTGGAPAIGWFAYAPLTERTFARSAATDFWALGLVVSGVGTIAGGVNFIATILGMRAPGMELWKVPFFVWTILWTGVLIIFAVPPLTAGLAMVLLDRNLGSHFFDVQNGGSAILWQHIFWFFGHPEVYILILPVFGIVTEIIPVFSRKVLFGYEFMAVATAAIAFISLGVWAHHMFSAGMTRTEDLFFIISTAIISVPTGIKFFNWLATLYGGRISFATPMLFCLGFLSMFLIGGLTGIMLAAASFNTQLTDSYFVVGHFHFVLIGGTLFGVFAGVYYWFPKVTGRMLSERLGYWQFWLLYIGFILTFGPMHISGMLGMPRRIFTYDADRGWTFLNQLTTVGALIQASSFLVFFLNVFVSLRNGKAAGDDPWNAWTLEWATTSPPPSYNFETIPTVCSRRPLWDLKHPDDPDWLYENEDHSQPTTESDEKAFPVPPPIKPERTLSTGQWGLLSFLLSEVGMFGTLIVTYLYYLGRDTVGPKPEILALPLVLFTTFCLLCSSGTVHLAEGSLHRGKHKGFLGWWVLTILLGIVFLGGTAYEWHELIFRHGLTLQRNLFGTTYFTLVGLHALHVTAGVLMMSVILGLGLRRQLATANQGAVGLVSWYWHFVDVVWVVVFTVVYLVGR
jgi:cytochrome c oxidase subunit I